MVGKITTLLVKKEAEAYCSQGLHREAMALFSSLLEDAEAMDPAMRAGIESRIKAIRKKIRATDAEGERDLSPEEIRCLREGWDGQSPESDTMVCAQAFYQVGAYDQAMAEYTKLLSGPNASKTLIRSAAECLVHLHPPDAFPAAAEALARKIRSKDKAVWSILVFMARHLESQDDRDHALSLYERLAQVSKLAACVAPRIKALSAPIPDPIEDEVAPKPPLHPTQPASSDDHQRFSPRRIAARIKSLMGSKHH